MSSCQGRAPWKIPRWLSPRATSCRPCAKKSTSRSNWSTQNEESRQTYYFLRRASGNLDSSCPAENLAALYFSCSQRRDGVVVCRILRQKFLDCHWNQHAPHAAGLRTFRGARYGARSHGGQQQVPG